MVAFNFQARFAPKVLRGTKRTTIRKDRKDNKLPCQPGDDLQLYYGQRTKQCRKIRDDECTALRRIIMNRLPDGRAQILLGPANQTDAPIVTKNLDATEMRVLAQGDGFADTDDMFDFFEAEHGGNDVWPFSGWQITWRGDGQAHPENAPPLNPTPQPATATTAQPDAATATAETDEDT